MELTFSEEIRDRDAYLDLEAAASEPYSRFVYETPAEARAVSSLLVEARTGEIAPPLARAVLDESGRTVAMLAGPIGKKELGRARLFAAKKIRDAGTLEGSAATLARSELARHTLMTLEEGDQYLSRIAVAPDQRGRGVAAAVLARFLDDCRAKGGKRAVLEVSPASEAAVRLYEKAGFATLGDHRAEHPESGRVLVYRHMALTL